MDIAHQIYEEVQQLPDDLAKEVLEFIGYIGAKHRLSAMGENGLKKAQEKVMENVWGNRDDEVWNDL